MPWTTPHLYNCMSYPKIALNVFYSWIILAGYEVQVMVQFEQCKHVFCLISDGC